MQLSYDVPSNLSKMKLIQIGLLSLCERWPMKSWASLPNNILLEIGLAVVESKSRYGDLIYLPKEIDQIIDNMLEYDENLYYTRSGRGFVYDDGLHALNGELESFMTINE